MTVKPIEWFLERIKTDTKAEDIGKFRHYIARFGSGLMKPDEIKAVKEASKILPTTFAAFTGADGKSVEILVSVSQKDVSTKPQTEAEIDTFCKAAYEVALGAYSGVLPKPIERQTVTARSCFRMTLDESPYYNSQATPMMVQIVRNDLMPTDESGSEQREMDYHLYEDYELIYQQAAHEAFEETADVVESQRYNAYMTDLAHKLCARL